MDIVRLLEMGFMQRAILAGIIISLLCAIWGVFVVVRNQAFLSDAVAHASLTGIAVGILLGWGHLPLALLAGISLAAGITYLKGRTDLKDDVIIGILYTFLFALGVILLSLFPGFRPDLFSYLFGSLLTVTWTDVGLGLLLLIISLVLVAVLYRKLLYVAFDPEAAGIRGIDTVKYNYFINILISVVVIISIKSVGIVMVSALLLIPASTSKLLARNFKQMFPYSAVTSLSAAIIGIIVSYYLSIPAGATIVMTAALIFFAVLLYRRVYLKS